MNVEAIKKQIEILEVVKAKQLPFDLAHFVVHNPCGTQACAFGWFAIMAQWPGLTVRPTRHEIFGLIDYRVEGSTWGRDASAAIKLIFDLNHYNNEGDETVDYIFYGGQLNWGKPTEQITPQDVIDRLNLLLELGEVEFVKLMSYRSKTRSNMSFEDFINAVLQSCRNVRRRVKDCAIFMRDRRPADDPRSSHLHKCRKCGFVWQHSDDCAGDYEVHTCPCGKRQLDRYNGKTKVKPDFVGNGKPERPKQ